MSDELMCKVLPLVGLGTRTHIKAGHAALVIIENETGRAQYFDFGRYVTPKGKGRVRGARTDIELEIPFKAEITDGALRNLDQFLLWLDAHPEKTHGSGRLVASLCEAINYEKALEYILELQGKGSIPYKAFLREGSNCARFVTETILASTEDKGIIRSLKHNKKFTPSTVGNVEKSASCDIYQVSDGVISDYTSTALRENLTNYFDKKVRIPTVDTNKVNELPAGSQYLEGTGSSAWFHLEANNSSQAIVRRYTENKMLDFEGYAILPVNFDATKAFEFVYDSNCKYCTITQSNECFRLELTRKKSSNLKQRAHSA